MDNLKTIIIALNQKVKAKEDLENHLNGIQQQVENANEGREQLKKELEESAKQVQEHQLKNQKFQELIIEENKNWNLVDHEKDQMIAKKDKEIMELKQQLSQKDRKVNELHLEL